jgi:hypothetical protein
MRMKGMHAMRILPLSIAIAALLVGATPAQAGYKYSAAEAEYILELPDAPKGETILAQRGNVPYLDNPPKNGAVGEIAQYKRVDPDTADFFDVLTIFVKADRDFVTNLTEAQMKATLEKIFGSLRLENKKFSFSQGKDSLKWATYSGFSVNRNNEVVYNIAHYLVGKESVMTVKVSFSVQNKQYNEDYKVLASSLKYMGR